MAKNQPAFSKPLRFSGDIGSAGTLFFLSRKVMITAIEIKIIQT
ncbi:MAG: hypothetical protein BWX77_00188 [Bacteroidetes bacterium ADurb.Bin090]|nr:MAG: hypothetical protein BWX77_00188 [Bacteroidetes bacterium ADurb.Bin090]